ncbi:unnamed protein product [Prunus armeniaca]|uniref:1,4-alpha-D-glucan glucanohydrolase n=1 Tax=Prunus armeniaca TaxID=36596 RepID=A0A6J5UAC8_PRUAR|nr:unnamed protein product [Prunus armeniaca]
MMKQTPFHKATLSSNQQVMIKGKRHEIFNYFSLLSPALYQSPAQLHCFPNPFSGLTFIDNHDTSSTQNIWPFPSDKVMQGYAYILTHPGIPSIVSFQI